MPLPLRAVALLASLACPLSLAQPVVEAPTPTPPSPAPELRYDKPFFPGARHDASVPTVRQLIGIDAGDRAATPAEIEKCFRAWADTSDRATLVEHARSYEGRPLFHLIVTRPGRQARLGDIKAAYAKLSDQRGVSRADIDRAMRDLPGVAWMGYSIHGDETSGADAALALAYHLVADQSDETRSMLDDLVIIIDPMMNPDGRERFLKMIQQHRGNAPDTDNQSLLHTGYWPRGRGNHYLFDLNRDSIFGVHPETRGRLRAVSEWRPLLFVDAHEMWPLDTFLFAPGRAPQNPHFPARRGHWNEKFAADQADAFDGFGWRYYTGEWNEGWYPGYTDAWAALKGAVGILYEQARIADTGVLRPEGATETYKESVHKQYVSSIANLRSLRTHKADLLREFVAERAANIARDGAFGNRVYAINPGSDEGRRRAFLDLMELQGVEVHEATRGFSATGKDALGRAFDGRAFPEGTLLIAAAQPDAPLASALLELDTPMPGEFLTEERRELLRKGESRLYDTTAWNIPMLYGMEAFELTGSLPAGAERVRLEPVRGGVDVRESRVGWAIDGADDRSVVAAAQLMERGVRVRLLDKATDLDGRPLARGTIFVLWADNRANTGLVDSLDEVARVLGVAAVSLDTGRGVGDAPDLGGGHLLLLERPRVALVGRANTDPTDYGAIWHTIDHRLGMRAAYLDADTLSSADLRRYNTLVFPNGSGRVLRANAETLRAWVEAGGTLIAIGNSAAAASSAGLNLSSARTLGDAIEKLDEYALDIVREHEGLLAQATAEDVYSHTLAPAVRAPWEKVEALPSTDELKRRAEWNALFAPQGAIVAARTDDRHWLTVGVEGTLPVLVGGESPLLAKRPTEAPVRLGVYIEKAETSEAAPATAKPGAEEEGKKQEEPKLARFGFAPAPEGYEPRLRMSGLLWPEAAHSLMNSAYLTRDRVGSGQVICFASPPAFRGATLGTARLLHNAIVYGPGAGASHPIRP